MSDSISQENFMTNDSMNHQSTNSSNQGSATDSTTVNKRQKSWELLDQSALNQTSSKSTVQHQVS